MKMSGEGNVTVEARRALLDALEALTPHLDSLILVGSQAIYIHASGMKSPVAEFTKDADLTVDSRSLAPDPLIELLMAEAGFSLKNVDEPGGWWNQSDVRVDIMVAESFAGSGSRSVKIPPHNRLTARSTKGIEGCLIDNSQFTVAAHSESDSRSFDIRVAGPASLLIAKVFKIHDRVSGIKRKIEDKDAHDVYRLLWVKQIEELLPGIRKMLDDDISRAVTIEGLSYLKSLFAAGPEAEGSFRAGRAEFGVGDPENVAQSVARLASDLIEACVVLKLIS